MRPADIVRAERAPGVSQLANAPTGAKIGIDFPDGQAAGESRRPTDVLF
jgi:hypothetical protein